MQFSLIIRSFIIACMFLPHALADQIILANGDVLQGKVKAQSESHIIWLSDSFGDLTIELNQVRAIEIQEVADTDPNIVSNQLPVKIKDEKQTLQGSVGLSGSFRSGQLTSTCLSAMKRLGNVPVLIINFDAKRMMYQSKITM